MALVLIASPGNSPTQVSDWAKINNVFQSIGLRLGNGRSVAGGFIQRGTIYFIAGAYYAADSDTVITGTASDYVRLTNTGGVITPEYVTTLDGVSWNKTWQGFYDISLSLFIFDEMKAYGAGVIDAPESIKNWRPIGTDMASLLAGPLGGEWLGALQKKATFEDDVFSMTSSNSAIHKHNISVTKTATDVASGTTSSLLSFTLRTNLGMTINLTSLRAVISATNIEGVSVREGSTVLASGTGALNFSISGQITGTPRTISISGRWVTPGPSSITATISGGIGGTDVDIRTLSALDNIGGIS